MSERRNSDTGSSPMRSSTLIAAATLVDLKDLVESRVMEDVADVRIEIDHAQPGAAFGKPLLRRQQESQAGAGDVVEAGEIDGAALGNGREDGRRLLHLRRVESADEKDLVVGSHFDLEHVNPSVCEA